MPKSPIAVYVEPSLRERLKKAMLARQKISPPGWDSVSSYAAYLLEEGLKIEEKFLLEEQQIRQNRSKKRYEQHNE
jgi:hypothetical protein